MPKKLPKPFSRPAISLAGAESDRRFWRKDILVAQLDVGDMILGLGTIDNILKAPNGGWLVSFMSGNAIEYTAADEVEAFTKAVR